MILSSGGSLVVDMQDRPETNAVPASSLEDAERAHIHAVMEKTGWRVRGMGGAAEILGLKPTTLESKMKKLGIKRKPLRPEIS
jgi:transcriptional regulator with GAF, ATPase, and Fis domain